MGKMFIIIVIVLLFVHYKPFKRTELLITGYKRIFTVDVEVEDCFVTRERWETELKIPFRGTIQSNVFQGEIENGACDIWKLRFGIPYSKCATYTIKGKDTRGETCEINIVNEDTGSGWMPRIHTNCSELSYLNNGNCKALLKQRGLHGPLVHIYYKPNSYDAL